MGTGWRRAFCTTVSRDSPDSRVSEKQQKGRRSTSPSPSPSPSPRSCTRLSFFSGGSNPSTPRLQSRSLRCRTNSSTSSDSAAAVSESPRILECKTTTPGATPKSSSKSPRTSLLGSNPTSPRSPLKLSLFKNSFKFRSSCGICLSSVKTGQGTAIYTAECGHAFHFPCIAAHVRKNGSLVCPVCNATWKDVPLLAVHKNSHLLNPESAGEDRQEDNDKLVHEPKTEDKKIVESSPSPSPSPSPRAMRSSPKSEATVQQLQRIRSYDDDEPLFSSTANAKISPIPEADEDADEDEEDVEEFQGFFVNPNPSCSSKFSDEARIDNARDLRNNVQVRLLPEAAVVSVSSSHQTSVVALRVKAPPPPPPVAARFRGDSAHRAPVDLVAVLDASGSMTGAKLQMLKRAMRLVISSLGSADRLSIVAFSAAPKRLLPLRRMTSQGQRAARRIVDRLVSGQGTSVGDALRKATKVLEDRRERNPVASIILLSDGQDDGGGGVQSNVSGNNQRQSASQVSSTRFAHIEIPVHAFGFGKNGRYGFSHTHEPAENAFAKCVGGLLSVVVQDLRIQLGFPSGDAEISAVYSCSTGRPTLLGSGSVRIGDLYAEEERELLVELRVPTAAAVSHRMMSFRCLYKDPATKEVVHGKEQGIMVPPSLSVRSSGPKIERLRNVFIATRAVAESRRLLESGGDFTSAHHLLASSRALLMQSSLESADECVRGLEAELAELHWRRQHQVDQQTQSQNHHHHQVMMTMAGTGMTQRRRGGKSESLTVVDENGDPLTPTSAWRAAEKLAKVALMKKSLNRVSDLHGFENARF